MKPGHSLAHHRPPTSPDAVAACVRAPVAAAPDQVLWGTRRSGSRDRHLPGDRDLVDLHVDLPVALHVDLPVDVCVDLLVDPVPDEATTTRLVGINLATLAEVGGANEPMRSDRRAPASSASRAVALPSI
jgi:hypothetical protein